MRRLERKTLLATAITAAVILAARPSAAIAPDPFSSLTQPANALLMPFDAMPRSSTWLQVSNVGGLSPVPGSDQFRYEIVTHWVFWRENGTQVAEVFACLTLNDTVEMNTTAIQSIDRDNVPFGPRMDLTGIRGFVVVTAYAADESCAFRSADPAPVDDAIVGSYAIREGGLRYGSNALGFGLDATGSFTDLPDLSLGEDWRALGIQTMAPDTLRRSRVVVMAVQEKRGQSPYRSWEIGPASGVVSADLTHYDAFGIATSLPPIRFVGALFATAKTGDPGSLIPGWVSLDSPSVLQLGYLSHNGSPVGLDTFVWAIHAQAKGKRVMTVNGVYRTAPYLIP